MSPHITRLPLLRTETEQVLTKEGRAFPTLQPPCQGPAIDESPAERQAETPILDHIQLLMTVLPMDLTPELVALCERKIEEPGPDPRWMKDPELRAFAQGLMAQRPKGPFWIFAYGSLIWNPTFTSVRQKRGTARGWHRSFCLELDRWRATPEQRGLMMALDHGGSCAGLLYELPEEGLDQNVFGLVWREISFRHDLGTVRWLTVESADGPVTALAFWAGPKGQRILRKLPPEKVAAVIARACGHMGSNAAYLHNTVLHLAEAGIYDRNLWHLQKLVAREIRALHGIGEA